MGKLTTHILDTSKGASANGVPITLMCVGDVLTKVKTAISNSDGRTDRPILDVDEFRPGTYQLVFQMAEYFASGPTDVSKPPFLDHVILQFTLASELTYHIPLLVSPWSYSTYRGS